MSNFQNMFNYDPAHFNEMNQKNFDSLLKASQVTMENSQAIARRVGEIFQRQVADSVEATKDLFSVHNPEQAMHKQQNFAKAFANDSIANSKEVVEMASKSVIEVYDIFTKRAAENLHSAKKAPAK